MSHKCMVFFEHGGDGYTKVSIGHGPTDSEGLPIGKDWHHHYLGTLSPKIERWLWAWCVAEAGNTAAGMLVPGMTIFEFGG